MEPLTAAALGALGLAVPAVALVWWQDRRRAAAERAGRLAAEDAETGRQMLAAVPDGRYSWDHAEGRESCSRRLAVLLDLGAGTGAGFADVLKRFEGDAKEALAGAVERLRGEGLAFELVLPLDGARRSVHAVGGRAADVHGRPLADVVWMRDATHLIAAAAPDDGDDALRVLLDTLPFPVWLRDAELEPAFTNRAGDGIARAGAAKALAARARSEERGVSERHIVTQGDDERLFDITETPLPGGSQTLGFAIDRSPDAAVRTPKDDLAAHNQVLENLATAVAIFAADTRLTFFNQAYAELWRLDPDWLSAGPPMGEILGQLREHRRLPEFADFRAFREEQLAQFTALGERLETMMHLPDGATIRCIASPHPLGGLVLTYEDVTDRLDLERSFKSLTAVQRETLDNLYEGIAVFGGDGRLKLNNPAFAMLWNLESESLGEDTHIADFIESTRPFLASIADWESHKERLIARLMSREAGTGRLMRDDGTVLQHASVPLPDGGVLLSYMDVTDGYKVESALRDRAEALADADRLKSEFIANVSFEVRTPLTSIMGFAEVLSEEYFGKLNRRQKEYSQGILESSRTLMAIVSDILDLATIDAGRMALEIDTVDLHSMLAGVLGLIRERARRKALAVSFDCAPDIGWIVADTKRLRQVVFNLLGNAVAFTPPRGKIALAAERRDDEVTIRISDSGAGIPRADHERVFQPFERGPARDDDGSGSGLGLTLVRRFVELHGGRVEMTSGPGKGTTVTCILPVSGATP
ncbi:MAG: PAS-domain containing protein [Rhodospirillales bacterium]|jgi:signal transduction histidine kinase|nr:PAS-domain containing protein [Rhodospirillales bacterium]